MIRKIKELFVNKEFFLFLIVGCINTVNCIIFSTIFSAFIKNAQISFIIGYVLSLTVAYLLNSAFIFREKLVFDKYIKFCISYIPNFIIQNVVVFIVYAVLKTDIIIMNVIELRSFVSYALAAVIGIPITFLCVKLFAFRKKGTNNENRKNNE